MDTSTQKPELLAPAGNRACLSAAIHAGADAVYFGVDKLNMRAGAENFTVQDIPEIARLCEDAGVKKYLALNTIVFSSETACVQEILVTVKDFVDAVIAWDPAVLQTCFDLGIPVHLSTQASVANTAAARFYAAQGVHRIVPARECTLEELARIRSEVNVELETFVHGAMCVSVSGRCFLSQFTTGRSGNRGDCVQNCRRAYRVMDEDGETDLELNSNYLLSAKDLCALPFIDQLIDAGIDAFKIEGRNKGPDYVATTVSCYRRAIDAVHSGKFSAELANELVGELKTVFYREFSTGFYLGRPIAEFTSKPGNRATRKKHFVGRITNYFANAGVLEMEVLDSTLGTGDSIRIQGPTTGDIKLVVEELRINDKPVHKAVRGSTGVTLPCPEKTRRNDRVFVLEKEAMDA